MPASNTHRTVLIVGASRGLGLALVGEYLRLGWRVIATIREASRSDLLQSLAFGSVGALEIEYLDITDAAQITELRKRLEGRNLDLLFVNAGVATDPTEPIGQVSTNDFVRLMVTNALGPLRVIEQFIDLVTPTGTVAVMSSALGSVASNIDGTWEAYRASKAARNTLMRSCVARHTAGSRTLLAIAPGWVRTDMGGPNASLDIKTSIQGVVDTIERRSGSGGMVYVDYQNQIVPW
jgi:NAD(P)-dependent dehydrogenase (short-subunit alcohol dehydrogenase family)